jgi:hypothetical protein
MIFLPLSLSSMALGAFVYSLCFVTALACAVLLTRAYRTSRLRLLFWSALCFWGLSLSNALAFIDIYVVPQHDLYEIRLGTGLLSVSVLLYGMVWESR